MVFPDDSEIKKISEKFGASVPFLRNEQKSGDNIGIKDVIIDVINKYLKINKHFDYVCCIFPSSIDRNKKYNFRIRKLNILLCFSKSSSLFISNSKISYFK